MKTLVLTGFTEPKIQAIKTFRAASGWGLKESKETIDSLDVKGIHKIDETDDYPSLRVTEEMIICLRRGGIKCHVEDPTSRLAVWIIWRYCPIERITWVENAWEDDQVSENRNGFDTTVKAIRSAAASQGQEVRVQKVYVPGVLELFSIPEAEAEEAARDV